MSKDNPEFLETIDEVRQEVRRFNSGTDSLMTKLRSETRDRLASIVNLGEDETLLVPRSAYFPTAMRFVENQGWFNYLAQTIPVGFTIEEIVSSSPVSPSIELWRNDIYMLNALIFARGLSVEEIGKLSKALASIAQNVAIIQELLKRRSERKQLEATLGQRLKAFSQAIHDLLHSIDTYNYVTLCDCCPKEK